MNFVSYKKDGNRYTFIQTLRMGGEQGLIAKHVRTLRSNMPRIRWDAGAQTLLSNMGGGNAILFVNTAEPEIYYEVEVIVGITSESDTELVLRMEVIRAIGDPSTSLERVPLEPKRPALCESMLLTGGYSLGRWSWESPKMGIGAVIV